MVWALIVLTIKLQLTISSFRFLFQQCVDFCFILCVSGCNSLLPRRSQENHFSPVFLCVFVFCSKEKVRETAGERTTDGQGIKSFTHRDGCAPPGTVTCCPRCPCIYTSVQHVAVHYLSHGALTSYPKVCVSK